MFASRRLRPIKTAAEAMLPRLFAFDEPEVGLHPGAMARFASVAHSTSHSRRIIIPTQSAPLLDQFEAEHVTVVEQEKAETVRCRAPRSSRSRSLARRHLLVHVQQESSRRSAVIELHFVLEPEDVDDGPNTAPAKRLARFISSYENTETRGLFGEHVKVRAGLDTPRTKCPRLGTWLTKLEALGERTI